MGTKRLTICNTVQGKQLTLWANYYKRTTLLLIWTCLWVRAHPSLSYFFLILFFYQGMYLGNEPAMQLMEQLRTNTTLVNLNLSVQLFIITPLLSTLITKKLTFMNSQGKWGILARNYSIWRSVDCQPNFTNREVQQFLVWWNLWSIKPSFRRSIWGTSLSPWKKLFLDRL